MKSYLILLLVLFSCRPELVEMPADKNLLLSLQSQFPSVTSAVSLKNVPSDCGLPPCDLVIPEANAGLQIAADSLCQAVYGCVDCCIDGKAASAILYVEPKSPPCPVALELPRE
ncbi:MAG: hypothetical protein AAB316_13740 [Bacteroidota bacterium]